MAAELGSAARGRVRRLESFVTEARWGEATSLKFTPGRLTFLDFGSDDVNIDRVAKFRLLLKNVSSPCSLSCVVGDVLGI